MAGKGKTTPSGRRSAGSKIRSPNLKTVEFTFEAPEAMEVFVAGEFNQWDPCGLAMKKTKDGVWKAKIDLPPGRHEYKLFSDDEWVEDAAGDVNIVAPSSQGRPEIEVISNPFGTNNFAITL